MKLASILAIGGGKSAHYHLLTRAAGIAVLSLLVKVAALGKDISVARCFGAGADLDAFLVAFAVPLFTWAVVAQSFTCAFIPTLIRVRNQQSAVAATQLIRAGLGTAIAMLTILSVALTLAADGFLPLIAWGFDAEQLALTKRLFLVLVWLIPFSGIATYFGAILNASDVFKAVALAPVAIPVGTLIGLLLFVPHFGIDALAWGTVAGYVGELGLVCLAMRLRGLPVLPIWRGHEQASYIARQYGYVFAGSLLMSSSSIIDQSMATWLGSGSVSVLNYGYKLVAVLLGTVSVGISTAVFPDFCRLAAAGDGKAIKQMVKLLVKLLLLASIPSIALLMIFSRPIVSMLFQRGAMTAETVSMIALVQMCYLLQIPIYLVGILGSRLLTALGGNQVMLRIAAANLVTNVVGNLVFMQWFGVAGIALSTSCVYLVSTVLLYASLRTRLRNLTGVSETLAHPALAA